MSNFRVVSRGIKKIVTNHYHDSWRYVSTANLFCKIFVTNISGRLGSFSRLMASWQRRGQINQLCIFRCVKRLGHHWHCGTSNYRNPPRYYRNPHQIFWNSSQMEIYNVVLVFYDGFIQILHHLSRLLIRVRTHSALFHSFLVENLRLLCEDRSKPHQWEDF